VATVRTRELGERCAFEAQLDVLRRRARGIGARPEVLERVQSRRRLPEDEGQQREEGDQRSAGQEQVRFLGDPGIL
jgi:hypothetical protein